MWRGELAVALKREATDRIIRELQRLDTQDRRVTELVAELLKVLGDEG
jgi:hypothetical protein